MHYNALRRYRALNNVLPNYLHGAQIANSLFVTYQDTEAANGNASDGFTQESCSVLPSETSFVAPSSDPATEVSTQAPSSLLLLSPHPLVWTALPAPAQPPVQRGICRRAWSLRQRVVTGQKLPHRLPPTRAGGVQLAYVGSRPRRRCLLPRPNAQQSGTKGPRLRPLLSPADAKPQRPERNCSVDQPDARAPALTSDLLTAQSAAHSPARITTRSTAGVWNTGLPLA